MASNPKEKYYAIILVNWGFVRIKAEIIDGLILRVKFAGLKVMEKPLSSLKGKKEKETEEKETKEKEKKAAVSVDLILSLKDDIIRIFKEISFGHFYVKLRFGLDDSAETGMLYGFLMAFKGILYSQKKVVLEAYPDFTGFVFEPECDFVIFIKRVYRMFYPAFGIYKKITKTGPGKESKLISGGV
ncbi:MAG: DUF2953 domain-containing protein [Methanomicrobium sp.]|nr:DUF2953 domain-containing protein [Methanomicrobium sp.]